VPAIVPPERAARNGVRPGARQPCLARGVALTYSPLELRGPAAAPGAAIDAAPRTRGRATLAIRTEPSTP